MSKTGQFQTSETIKAARGTVREHAGAASVDLSSTASSRVKPKRVFLNLLLEGRSESALFGSKI